MKEVVFKVILLVVIASSLLAGCVVVEPNHHYPRYRTIYVEPARDHHGGYYR